MTTQTQIKGSSEIQGKLWGARSRDWAEIQEGACRALFETVLRETHVGRKTAFLDVGCGAGMAASLAAGLGAAVSGIDGAEPLIEIAKERTPAGDFRIGEMETLPYAGAQFEVVTGFNSFQYAASPVSALREAKRVAKKNGAVAIAVWGAKERCEASAYLAALGALLPPPPPGAPGPFALSAPGALEAMLGEASWKPEKRGAVTCVFEYADADTAGRGLMSAGPSVRAIQIAGEDRVRAAVLSSIEPFRTSRGGYRLENEFVYVIARS